MIEDQAIVIRKGGAPPLPVIVYDLKDMAELIERETATVIPSWVALDMAIEIERLKAGG